MGWWSDTLGRRRFDRLVRSELDGLLRFAVHLCRDPVAGEDLVQEALVNAIARLDTLREDAAFRVWARRVVYTTFLDRQDREARHARRAEAGGEAVMVRFPGPAERAEQRRIGRRIEEALAALPPDRRAAVVLVDVEGLSFVEAAEVLGVKVGTVASRVARGRAELRADLSDLAREEGVIG